MLLLLLRLTRSLLGVCHWLLIIIILARIWDLWHLLRITLGLHIRVDRLQLLVQRNMRLVLLVFVAALVLPLLGLESVALAALVVGRRRDALQLEAYACRTGPCVRRGGVTLDLASSASFTGSHHWRHISNMFPGAKRFSNRILTNPSAAYGDYVRPQRHNLLKSVSKVTLSSAWVRRHV